MPPPIGDAPERSTVRRLAPLCAAMFFGFLTVSVPLPVLPLHVHGDWGFGLPVAGLAVGIQSLATLLTRPSAGRSVDRNGAKLTLSRGLAIACCAGLAYALSDLAPLPVLGRLIVLLAGRVILGMGESLLITGVLSWAIVRAGAGRSGQAMSWNGMAQFAALAAGAPLGLALYEVAGFGCVALATIVLPLIALAIVWRLEPVPAFGGQRMGLASVVGRIWQPGLGLMLGGIGFATLTTFTSLAFAARTWPGAGLALATFGGAFIAVRLAAGGLPDRLGGRRIAMLSLAVEAAGQLVLWLAPVPLIAMLGAALSGAGVSLLFPSLGVEVVARVPIENRGLALGAFAAFQDLALGITGPVLGGLAAWFGPQVAFVGGAVAAVAGILVCTAITEHERPRLRPA